MKKIATIILVLFSFIGISTNAQTTACNADFNLNYQSGNTIQFIPVMTGTASTTQHYWLFGDGGVSNEVSPVHTYLSGPVFTVLHYVIVRNPNGIETCRDSASVTVQVQSPCNLVANFISSPVSTSPYTYHFQNTSTSVTGIDSVRWTFGDGATSNDINPNHTYNAPGTYNVCLRIQKFNTPGTVPCVSEICHQLLVQTPACNLAVSFYSYRDTTATSALTYHFENTTTPLGTTDSIKWTFGDGTSSGSVSPNHTYTQAGTYNVCLVVGQRDPIGGITNCVRYSCHTIVVQGPVPCTLIANFNSSHTTAGNNYHFTNTSTPLHTTDSIRWTFGDGTSSSDINPNHTYAQSGTYLVCLRIQQREPNGGLTNCVSEKCDSISVQIPPVCTLVVNFTSAATSATGTFHFENTSTPLSNTDSIRWTFGDGSASSEVSPNHTYTQSGTYTVCLVVMKREPVGVPTNCVRYICHTITVQIPPVCTLVANFYSIRDSLSVTPLPNIYHFVNTSTGLNPGDSIRWTFGDGTSSNQLNPTHSYAQQGTYTVCLREIKREPNGGLTNCISEICHVVVVQTPDICNVVPNFYSYPDTAAGTQNTYHFVNTTAPLNANDSIRWTFGDGTSSGDVNPNHTYAQAGSYLVCLRVQPRYSNGTLSTCVRDICHYVVIPPVCNIQAHFGWREDSANRRIIYFANQTISPASGAISFWSFGDGMTSTAWNPTHEYSQPGRYYVCLRVQLTPNCISYFCDSITVTASLPNCIQQSNFSIVRATNNTQLFYFTPAYLNNNWQYTWTFGDGTGIQQGQSVSHQYARGGNYTACLTVFRDSGCASTTCRQVNAITQVNCNNVNVSFTYQRDPVITNKVYLRTVSNYTVVDQTWTITRIPATTGTAPVILHQNNPAYLFNDTGYYQICLKAVTLGGCIKEYCQVIHIEQVVTPNVCSLQIYPNPVTTTLSFNLFLTQPQMIDVYIYNSMNLQVREKHQQGFAGTNIVSIPVADLVAGNYLMKVIHGNDICYSRFVKL